MADEELQATLRQGVEAWNKWRKENPGVKVDLSSANLNGAHLNEADLSFTDLSWADLTEASLIEADLRGANLLGAHLPGAKLTGAHLNPATLTGAHLNWADLTRANLDWANLIRADLSGAILKNAHLTRADLREARLNGANLEGAILTGCNVFLTSAWELKLDDRTEQSDLIITPPDQTSITVDNIEVAQFFYLLLHNEKIRQVIDTITSKVVLILGRFTPERKAVLDAIKDELRKRNYLPVMFDFEKPAGRDLTETISTLAHMARFIIADITDPRAVPVELERITPGLPSIPVAILIQRSSDEYALFDHIRRYSWVLEPYRYEDQAQLIASIGEKIIAPAEMKVIECKPH